MNIPGMWIKCLAAVLKENLGKMAMNRMGQKQKKKKKQNVIIK